MKKILVSFLAIALVGAILVSCSKKEAGGAASGSGGGNKVVTLTFNGWEASPLETQSVRNGIAKFESTHPNIKVTYTPGLSGSEYDAKLLASAAAGTMPDVMFVAANYYGNYVARNVLMDLTDKFDANFPLDDFIESSRKIMIREDGHVYGISSCTVSPIVFYNKDVFDAAGEPYPEADPAKCWTMDEFRAVAKRLTKDGVYGVYGLEEPRYGVTPTVVSAGGWPFSDDWKKSTINSPEAKKAFQTIKDIRLVDKSAPDASTLEAVGMGAAQMLETGQVAMLVAGSFSLQELAASGMNIGMAPLPSMGRAVTLGQAHCHAISRTTTHPEEAWEFLKFLSSIEYLGQNVSEGLWMPNRYSMYEPANVDKWYRENVHGDSYRHMLAYFRDALVDPRAMAISGRIQDIMREECDYYFKSDKPLDNVLSDIDKRADEAIQEILETTK